MGFLTPKYRNLPINASGSPNAHSKKIDKLRRSFLLVAVFLFSAILVAPYQSALAQEGSSTQILMPIIASGESDPSINAAAKIGPCDIFRNGGTPCVTAHSTTRALYRNYKGKLYELVRNPLKSELKKIPKNPKQNTASLFVRSERKIIYTKSRGGVANTKVHDKFCSGRDKKTGKKYTCYIVRIFDQSGNENHLQRYYGIQNDTKKAAWNNMAKASIAPAKLKGQPVYGVYKERKDRGGYRQHFTKNIPINDEPQGIYAVFDAQIHSAPCCFNYGNAQTNGRNNGPGTMETLYFGRGLDGYNGTGFTKDGKIAWGKGSGKGPWLMGDFEWGVYSGTNAVTNKQNQSIPQTWDFVTGFLKGKPGRWAIHGGNSQRKSKLKTYFDGPRVNRKKASDPYAGFRDEPERYSYDPSTKEGAVILGTGGDNSNGSSGVFFEGAITKGYPTLATENKVHMNIVNAGYQRIRK